MRMVSRNKKGLFDTILLTVPNYWSVERAGKRNVFDFVLTKEAQIFLMIVNVTLVNSSGPKVIMIWSQEA